jgi:uncharacterized membrane protein YqaE (UPF0057 family)
MLPSQAVLAAQGLDSRCCSLNLLLLLLLLLLPRQLWRLLLQQL